MTGDRNTNLNAHPAFRGARLSGGSAAGLADGVPLLPVPFTTIDYDDDGYVLSLSRLRIPRGLGGRYRVRAEAELFAVNNVSRWSGQLTVAATLLSDDWFIHSPAGLALDGVGKSLAAEFTGDLPELDEIVVALIGTYFPPVASTFSYITHALELHYLGRP